MNGSSYGRLQVVVSFLWCLWYNCFEIIRFYDGRQQMSRTMSRHIRAAMSIENGEKRPICKWIQSVLCQLSKVENAKRPLKSPGSPMTAL